jgi:hypothetical protein
MADDKLVFIAFVAVFLLFYFLPAVPAIYPAVDGGIQLSHEYALAHVLTCLVPAFFIAGAITTLLKKEAVLKYLGAKTDKKVSYGVASVSGSILAVCSCTVLPLFAGIWRRGAGLGPAITFLYSGPAINIAAIFLTASVLGFQLGAARAVSAVALSLVIGLAMAFIFRGEKRAQTGELVSNKAGVISLKLAVLFIFVQVLFLVVNGLQIAFELKAAAFAVIIAAVAYMALFMLSREQARAWLSETWGLSKSLLPLLFVGVFFAGAIQAVLPAEWVSSFLGGNGLAANLAASVFGAFMYFATLTEVPIIQALTAKGMGAGPSLALLLAGPSLSLPSMLVIHKILGFKKTAAYVLLVILFSTIAGLAYGSL